MADSATRLRFLDGLRGWAAFAVLIFHIFIDALPPNAFMAERALWSRVFVVNGLLAVCIFFVVSGISLSIRYLETGNGRGLIKIAAGRYFRLAIPIVAICTITYVLMASGLIGPAGERPAPLDMYLRFTPTIPGLLDFSLFKVFFAYSNAESYVPPLWTMPIEFFGSFVVFIVLAVVWFKRIRTVAFGLLFLALTFWQSYFALFIGGVLIANLTIRTAPSPATLRYGVALCAGGVILSLSLGTQVNAATIFTAMLLVAGVAFCPPIRALFENRLAAFLGWISFPLYLVQAPVIYAFSLGGLQRLTALGLDAETARWIIGGATIPAAILCAVAFCPVNDFAVKVSRKTGAAVAHMLGGFDRRLAQKPAA